MIYLLPFEPVRQKVSMVSIFLDILACAKTGYVIISLTLISKRWLHKKVVHKHRLVYLLLHVEL